MEKENSAGVYKPCYPTDISNLGNAGGFMGKVICNGCTQCTSTRFKDLLVALDVLVNEEKLFKDDRA